MTKVQNLIQQPNISTSLENVFLNPATIRRELGQMFQDSIVFSNAAGEPLTKKGLQQRKAAKAVLMRLLNAAIEAQKHRFTLNT